MFHIVPTTRLIDLRASNPFHVASSLRYLTFSVIFIENDHLTILVISCSPAFVVGLVTEGAVYVLRTEPPPHAFRKDSMDASPVGRYPAPF